MILSTYMASLYSSELQFDLHVLLIEGTPQIPHRVNYRTVLAAESFQGYYQHLLLPGYLSRCS